MQKACLGNAIRIMRVIFHVIWFKQKMYWNYGSHVPFHLPTILLPDKKTLSSSPCWRMGGRFVKKIGSILKLSCRKWRHAAISALLNSPHLTSQLNISLRHGASRSPLKMETIKNMTTLDRSDVQEGMEIGSIWSSSYHNAFTAAYTLLSLEIQQSSTRSEQYRMTWIITVDRAIYSETS